LKREKLELGNEKKLIAENADLTLALRGFKIPEGFFIPHGR
jgi:hypothetical protein